MKKAFTLVEVAVAGSLIGFCVLTAVTIIPRGLQTQNDARMKAAAAAAIMTLSAKAYATSKTSCMDVSLVIPWVTADYYDSANHAATLLTPGKLQVPLGPIVAPTPRTAPTVLANGMTMPPKGVNLIWYYGSATMYTSAVNLQTDFRYESSQAVVNAPDALYTLNPLPAVGELERRILFSYTDGDNGDTPTPQHTRTITTWLLNTDPVTGKPPMSARYLATFNEIRP